MKFNPLPRFEVIFEAGLYKTAAEILEKKAISENQDLFFPAAMNAALSIELFLKAFLVEPNGDFLQPNKEARRASHNLLKLYEAIDEESRKWLNEQSKLINPKINLARDIATYADYFEKIRYSYEEGSKGIIRGELFELVEVLEQLCTKALPTVVQG